MRRESAMSEAYRLIYFGKEEPAMKHIKVDGGGGVKEIDGKLVRPPADLDLPIESRVRRLLDRAKNLQQMSSSEMLRDFVYDTESLLQALVDQQGAGEAGGKGRSASSSIASCTHGNGYPGGGGGGGSGSGTGDADWNCPDCRWTQITPTRYQLTGPCPRHR